MVLTPAAPPEKGMPENAISYDGPIDLIGNPHCLAEGICAACATQKSLFRIAPKEARYANRNGAET